MRPLLTFLICINGSKGRLSCGGLGLGELEKEDDDALPCDSLWRLDEGVFKRTDYLWETFGVPEGFCHPVTSILGVIRGKKKKSIVQSP